MKEDEKKAKRKKGWLWGIFILYLAGLVSLLLFKHLPGEPFTLPELEEGCEAWNLSPFQSIKRFWNARGTLPARHIWQNLLGNVLVFLPFGLIGPFLGKEKRRGTVFLAGLALILLIEFLQLALEIGVFDIDDILLNSAGILLGLLLSGLFKKEA